MTFGTNDRSRTGRNGPDESQARRHRSAQLLLIPLFRYEIAVQRLGSGKPFLHSRTHSMTLTHKSRGLGSHLHDPRNEVLLRLLFALRSLTSVAYAANK